MRICSIRRDSGSVAGVLIGTRVFTLPEINAAAGAHLPTTLSALIREERVEELRRVATVEDPARQRRTRETHRRRRGDLPVGARAAGSPPASAGLDPAAIPFAAPYPDPPKIWGIGLNYVEHAADLKVKAPDEPASFMRPATTIIGPGDPIRLPRQSQRVTAEAELAVILGRRCRDLTLAEAPGAVLGFTLVLDMTAEDILQRNPRFLTRAKSFDTFFSFGPWIVTPDEIPDLAALRISTVLNGRVARTNVVANMAFPPYDLVAFHSAVMTLLPGDIISTGTPGAVVIAPGDRVACDIVGLGRLENPVA